MTQHKGSSRQKYLRESHCPLTDNRLEDREGFRLALPRESYQGQLPSLRPNVFQTTGFQICPVVSEGSYEFGDYLTWSNGVLQFPIVDRHCPLSLPLRFGLLPHGRPPARPVPAILLKGGRECRRGVGIIHRLGVRKKKGILLNAYVPFSHRRPETQASF